MNAYTPKRAFTVVVLAALIAVVPACDFLDPTAVDNPRTTDDDLADAAEPTAALLPGLRAQFARAISSVVTNTEVISDNYSIHGTGLNKGLDEPAGIGPSLMNAGPYSLLQELRALSEFVLDEIVPGDATATPEQIAEAQYYRGMAYLMLAENFVGAVLAIDEPAVGPAELINRAVAAFDASLTSAGTGDFALPARAALARTYRIAGNAAAAEAAAAAVLAADPSFAFIQEFDASSVDNGPHNFLVQRALQEMQPLPRLDFLDPKYTTEESGIPIAKAEEMHLILAEIDLASNNAAAAREHIAQAIEVALSRPTTSFNDNDLRRNANLTIRPRDAVIMVRADATSPFRAGLVLSRPGTLQTPHISATSLDADSIRALATTDEEAIWHAFHLARQEILFLEGRRMSDLGIRLPIMLTEIDTNSSIGDGDPGTIVSVPSYIPALDGMDLFTPSSPYEGSNPPVLQTDEITIDIDMNRRLAEGRVSAFN